MEDLSLEEKLDRTLTLSGPLTMGFIRRRVLLGTGKNTKDVEDLIERKLRTEEYFLTETGEITNNIAYTIRNINLAEIESILVKNQKLDAQRTLFTSLRLAREAVGLWHYFIRDDMSRFHEDVREKYENGPTTMAPVFARDGQWYRNDRVTLLFKSYVFIVRMFIDELLRTVNCLDRMLYQSPRSHGQTPSRKLQAFSKQVLNGRLDHLDDRIIAWFRQHLKALVELRELRNYLKEGKDVLYTYGYTRDDGPWIMSRLDPLPDSRASHLRDLLASHGMNCESGTKFDVCYVCETFSKASLDICENISVILREKFQVEHVPTI